MLTAAVRRSASSTLSPLARPTILPIVESTEALARRASASATQTPSVTVAVSGGIAIDARPVTRMTRLVSGTKVICADAGTSAATNPVASSRKSEPPATWCMMSASFGQRARRASLGCPAYVQASAAMYASMTARSPSRPRRELPCSMPTTPV